MEGLGDYERWMRGQGLSRNTIAQRVGFVESRLRAWGTLDKPAWEIVEWLDEHHGWTRYTYVNHLKSVYAWLVETGQLEESPISRVRPPKQPPPRPAPLTVEQMNTALETADLRLRAWLLLGALAGLRCHEIAKFRGDDIDEQSITVLGKGGELALLPTHPALWVLAEAYPREGYWFPSPQAHRAHVCESLIANTIRAHFRAIGIPTGAVHRLRYTYGTELARAGTPIRVVQELLRHRSLDTTMRYVAVADSEKIAAIRALPFVTGVAPVLREAG